MDLILNRAKKKDDPELRKEPFGTKIPYHEAEVVWPDTSKLRDMTAANVNNMKSFDELIKISQAAVLPLKKTEVCTKIHSETLLPMMQRKLKGQYIYIFSV